MTLRKKTVLAAGGVLLSLVVMLYFVSQTLVMRSYVRLEEENTRHKVQETLNELDNQLRTITTITSDWAVWDDTYAFIQNNNQAYIRSNLADSTLKTLHLNTMLFIDLSGKLVYGKSYDLINEKDAPVSQGLLNYLTSDNKLLNHSEPDSINSGVILLPENPMLIVSYPVLSSEFQGPVRGSLIVGRYLDDHEVSMLTELSQETVTIIRLDSPALLEEYKTVSQALSQNQPIAVRPLNDRTVAGYSFIRDIYNKPALILSVKTPRDIYTQGRKLLYSEKPDMVLLDVSMPGMDGWQVCQRIWEVTDVPVIMLTGKQQGEEDVVRGLDYGADDYLFKPVGNRELVARVKAMLRRSELPPGAEAKREVSYSDSYLSVDIAERKVMINGERIKLTPREFRLFALLVESPGRILTHKELLEKVLGWEYTDDLDYVRIYVSHLRQKIEPSPASPKYILTEAGVGYYFQKTP